MSRMPLLSAIIALAVSCVSPTAGNKDKLPERLTAFRFNHHNSMAMYNGENYNVTTMSDGRIHVVIDEGFPGEKEFYLNDTTIFDELLTIVKTYKMDKYKENYKTWMDIRDGDSWSLNYTYNTSRSVSSGGYMAWPKNYKEMRNTLADYFQKWRNHTQGVLIFDYFKFTSKNNKGQDQEFTLERGDEEATMTLRDAERGIDKTINVSNDVLQLLQERANTVNLKSTIYDYVTDDKEATRCTYFVRYNTGDSISGITCHTQYPSHKVRGILDFFDKWLNE